jgi:hypothetical protein
MTININYKLLMTLAASNKDFLLFDLNNKKDTIVCYKLTSDLQRYKKSFAHFRVVSTLKNEIRNLKINI